MFVVICYEKLTSGHLPIPKGYDFEILTINNFPPMNILESFLVCTNFKETPILYADNKDTPCSNAGYSQYEILYVWSWYIY